MAKESMECVICSSKNLLFSKNTSDSIGKLRNIVLCNECQHMWRSPIPDVKELAGHYSVMQEQNSKTYLDHNNMRLKKIEKTFAGGLIKNANSILEIGPGVNGVLPIATSVKLYTAVELSKYNQKNLKMRNQHAIIYEDISEVTDKFDITVLISLLEHVSNPHELIHNASCRTNPNGYCIIGIPERKIEIFNEEKIFSNRLVELKNIWSTGNHLHSFSAKSVKHLVENSNMKIVKIESIDIGPFLKLLFQQNFNINLILEKNYHYSLRKIAKLFINAIHIRILYILKQHKKSDYVTIYTCQK